MKLSERLEALLESPPFRADFPAAGRLRWPGNTRRHALEECVQRLVALQAENKRLRDALEEIRNRSSIGVMRSDQSELEVVLADICLFVDAVLWKENSND